eukprot:gnl/MRDRNA2_/MRDRNA2_34391_c0_seq1.p1 gnl/MRDRNA2_/MRDRNA2_34391_c0~~gnl/MRDRNA2_/MRDRNA2_34391_c0_seq1.p1  ORF type:complete len:186 (+),score=37.08 gnl/MRDRNA2_/MRDRNA2_34391_c0_seq1:226-783(+)
MIDPNTQRKGEDYDAYNRRRWGGDGWTDPLRDRGQSMGLAFAGWKTWPNTMNAHRLCIFLERLDSKPVNKFSEKEKAERGVQLVNKFYELTYERGMNISTPEGAAVALVELGYATEAQALEYLRTGDGEEDVVEADSYAKRDLDIHGVPFFVISLEGSDAPPMALSGAQSSGAFSQVFGKLGVEM